MTTAINNFYTSVIRSFQPKSQMLIGLADIVCPKIKGAMNDNNLRVTYSDSWYCILEGHFILVRILLGTDGTYTVKMNGHSHTEVKLEGLNDLIITEIQIP